MNKIAKGLLRFLAQIALATILLMGGKIVMDGMWLLGLPEQSEIESVSIAYPDVTEEVKEAADPEEIELALKLTGFLKYDLFQKADNSQEPLISITYHLQDGTDRIISANRTTVWWKGKAYALKDQDLFVNLTEGIFFLAEAQAG